MKREGSGAGRDTIANLLGRGWMALMAFAFVPVYVHLLGVEAYGLVGFSVTLQAVFSLLDLGLATTLSRQLARHLGEGSGDFEGGPRQREARDLVRTLEIVYWLAALTIAATVALLAPVLTSRWLHPQALAPDTVTRAVRLLGLMIALQFPFTLYEGGLVGIHRQVALNVVLVCGATLRFAAVVGVLLWVSRTIEAFFAWQAVVAVAQTLAAGVVLWRWLPRSPHHPRFDSARLAENWRFAAGMTAISITAVLLTQMDKIVLSAMLRLDAFGAYTLAATAAGALYILFLPIFQAVFPRLSRLVAAHDASGVRTLYHKAAQAAAVLVLPAAAVLVVFGRDVMLLWTRDAAIADAAGLTLALLAAGTALNGLMNVPYALQLACGWTTFAWAQNAIALAVLVPALVLAAVRFGAPGAAAVWLLLHVGYVTVGLTIVHRRLLPGEQARWYRETAGPLAAAGGVALVIRAAVPVAGGDMSRAAVVAGAALLAYGAAAVSSPVGRSVLSTTLRRVTARVARSSGVLS